MLATGVFCFSAPVADNDLWGHVFFGRDIIEAGSLPAANRYSYTAPDHPWINHELIAEIAFAAVYDRAGAPGLLALKLLLGLATLGFMIAAANRRGAEPIARATGVAAATYLMSEGYLVRPQLFTYLGLAVLWERLHAFDRERKGKMLVPLPLMFAAWTNAHGGVIAGLGVLYVYCAFALPSAEAERRRQLFLLMLGSTFALLVNPYGLELPRFLLSDITLSRGISEWSPIPLAGASYLGFKLAIVVCMVGVLLVPRRWSWELAILSIAAVATFRHARHLPLFAILAAPFLAETMNAAWDGARRRLPARITEFRTAVAAIGLVALVAGAALELRWVYATYRGLRLQILVSPEVFPVDAVRFMRRNRLRGNLALPFDWGEYAIWHLDPECPVSIDGRYTTAYPIEVIEQSELFRAGAPGWDRILQNASLVLADRRQPSLPRLLRHPDWQYIYSDATAFVFVRRGVALPATLDRRVRTEPEDAFFFP